MKDARKFALHEHVTKALTHKKWRTLFLSGSSKRVDQQPTRNILYFDGSMWCFRCGFWRQLADPGWWKLGLSFRGTLFKYSTKIKGKHKFINKYIFYMCHSMCICKIEHYGHTRCARCVFSQPKRWAIGGTFWSKLSRDIVGPSAKPLMPVPCEGKLLLFCRLFIHLETDIWVTQIEKLNQAENCTPICHN